MEEIKSEIDKEYSAKSSSSSLSHTTFGSNDLMKIGQCSIGKKSTYKGSRASYEERNEEELNRNELD